MASSSYPYDEDDYHARFVHEMARALTAVGAEVRILGLAAPEAPAGTRTVDDICVTRVGYPGIGRAPLTGGDGIWEHLKAHRGRAAVAPLLVTAFSRAMRTGHRRWQPNVVLTHWLLPTGLAALSLPSSTTDVPVGHIAHASEVSLLERLPGGPLLARAIAAHGRVLAVSDTLATRCHQNLGIAATAWALGVDGPPQAAACTRRRPFGRFRLCTMGRLLHGKGVDRLLELVVHAPDVEVEVAGAGPAAVALEAQARSRGVGERFRLVGPVLNEDKSAFFARHDAFVFFGRPDGRGFVDNLPVSVVEALAHGLVVLTNGAGAVRELVGAHNGAVDENPRSALAAMRLWSDADWREKSAAARASVADRLWPNALSELAVHLGLAPEAGS